MKMKTTLFKISKYAEIITIHASDGWRYFRSKHTPQELQELMPPVKGLNRDWLIQFDINDEGTILSYELFEKENHKNATGETVSISPPRSHDGKTKVWWNV